MLSWNLEECRESLPEYKGKTQGLRYNEVGTMWNAGSRG